MTRTEQETEDGISSIHNDMLLSVTGSDKYGEQARYDTC